MPHLTRFGIIWRLLGTALVLVILASVACGSAAAPETTAPDTTAPGPTAAAAVAQPTAVPEAMSEPAEGMVEVNPGKLTWLMTGFGNERFDPAFSSSSSHDYGRLIHAHYISSDVEEGSRVLIPGILTKWELSSDGLTWVLTVREGVKFHDGTGFDSGGCLVEPSAFVGSPGSGVVSVFEIQCHVQANRPDRADRARPGQSDQRSLHS